MPGSEVSQQNDQCYSLPVGGFYVAADQSILLGVSSGKCLISSSVIFIVYDFFHGVYTTLYHSDI